MQVSSMTTPFSSPEFEAYSVKQPKIHSFLKKLEEKGVYNTVYKTEAISAKFFVDIEVDANKIEKHFFIKDTNTISPNSYTNFFKSIVLLLENSTENGKKEFNISVAALLKGNKMPNQIDTVGFTYKSTDPSRLRFIEISSSDEDVNEVKDNITKAITCAGMYVPRVKDQPQFDENFELIEGV